MTDRPKRRIRVRRKRRQTGGNSAFDVDDAAEAVGTFGCCLFEVVLAATVLVGLLTLPAVLLIN